MKVAIVNDSRMAVEVLRRVLATQPEFRLLWVAYSGEEALRQAREERPDILLMDMVMPGLDGAETTRRMMAESPCVVLVVTATTTGNRDIVFEAMGAGALDAVNTPVLGEAGGYVGAEAFVTKLKRVARLVQSTAAPAAVRGAVVEAAGATPLLGIGASTGGPQALARVLGELPREFPAAVLVAQHVDEQFAPGLREWLARHTALEVRLAQAGDTPREGAVYLAATQHHLVAEQGEDGRVTLEYTEHPVHTAYRPSVDALMRSLAELERVERVGVVLTGMGRDGAEGLLALRRAGALTLAQDAATSIVYGMPRAAAELGAAVEVLPLEAIGARVRELFARKGRTR